MEANRGLVSAMLQAKCPRCREGNMFKFSLFKISKFSSMHQTCPACHQKFEVEPGFFIGAMYVSYAMSVGVFLITGLALYHLFDDPELWVYLTVVTTLVVSLLPFMYRYSRVLYLYWFGGVHYQQKDKTPG